MRLLLFTCLVLTLAVFSNGVQVVDGQQPSGFLRGTVKLKEKPLAGVMVNIRSAQGGQKSSVSNAKGEYEILNVEDGMYLLTITNTPYVLSDGIGGMFMELEVKGNGGTTADVSLTRGAVLSGCVEYPSKQPVIERQIVYENSELPLNGFSLMNFRPTVVTNDQGCFRLYGLPSGKYRVGVGKPVNGLSTDLSVPFSPTYYPGVLQRSEAKLVEITAGNEFDLGTLILQGQTQTRSVKGTFVNAANGEAVPDLSFELVRYDENGINSISSLKSDDAGNFQVDNQAPGTYRIQAALRPGKSPSVAFRSVSFELTTRDTSNLVIRCSPLTASISGEIRINDNEPASNRDLSIALKEGDGIATSADNVHRMTLKSGKFDLTGLPRGVYTLVVLPLRASLQFEHAQVGPQLLRGSVGPFGIIKVDLTAGDQVVRIFLRENAFKTP